MTHPETHQNLIHPDKEQNRRVLTINVGGYGLLQEQNRHDPVTFPRAKAVFSDPSKAVFSAASPVAGKTADPAANPMTRGGNSF
jgi:hypothetical protein